MDLKRPALLIIALLLTLVLKDVVIPPECLEEWLCRWWRV